MKYILCGKSITLKLTNTLLICYVFSNLLYDVEGWTLTYTVLRKLEAFDSWVYRRLVQISWVDRVPNDVPLHRLGKDTKVIKRVKNHKLEYFGLVVLHPERYNMLYLIAQVKINGKRPRRRRTSWVKNLREWCNISSAFLIRAA